MMHDDMLWITPTVLRRRGFNITYFTRGFFNTPAASPLSNPISLDIGSLSWTDSQNRLLIADGELKASAANTAGAIIVQQTGLSRVSGAAVKARVAQVSAHGSAGNKFISPYFLTTDGDGYLMWTSLGSVNKFIGAENTSAVGDVGSSDAALTDTYYDTAIVLRAAGHFSLIKNSGGEWKLLYISGARTRATESIRFDTISADRCTFKIDYWASANLGGPWASDWGIATQRLEGARSAGDTFAHETAFWIEFTLTTVPSSGSIEIDVRRQDANNCWRLQVTSAGAYNLIEVVSGTPTTRATIASNIANDRLMLHIDGTRAQIYRSRGSAIATPATYGSVSTHASQVTGQINSLGTGGAVSNVTAYPRTIMGLAREWLEAL